MQGQDFIKDLLSSLQLDPEKAPSSQEWESFLGRLQQEWDEVNQKRELTIKSILNSSPNIIMTLDQHGMITEFNHVAQEKMAITQEEARGKHILEMIPSSYFRDTLQDVLGNTSLSARTLKIPTEVCSINGDKFQADCFVSKVTIGSETIYTIYVRDLTEEMKAKNDLELMRAQAAHGAKMAALGEMAAGVAHEINNPLTIISLSCRTLEHILSKDEIDKKMIKDLCHSVHQTTERIAKIIKGLRTFSRQSDSAEMTDLFIGELISDTLNLCREKFKSKGITLSFESDSNDLIHCNSISLSQVLLNLLNNSCDAIESLPEKWIRIHCSINPDDHVLSVTDSGAGIRPEILHKIMDPFFTTKEIGKGTGLGLSISKGIMEQHGGALLYDPTSTNTTFVLRFPRATKQGVGA